MFSMLYILNVDSFLSIVLTSSTNICIENWFVDILTNWLIRLNFGSSWLANIFINDPMGFYSIELGFNCVLTLATNSYNHISNKDIQKLLNNACWLTLTMTAHNDVINVKMLWFKFSLMNCGKLATKCWNLFLQNRLAVVPVNENQLSVSLV